MENKKECGKVWLVGAGAGDIGLLTKKAMEVLQEADVVVFDALVSLEILAILPENAELINVGKRSHNHLLPQEKINELLCEKAKEGKKVVRLKGGDPFVFGRGGEELELLVKEGISFEVIPGITSSIAVPAYNGIPVTHRDFTSSFHVITGHKRKDNPNGSKPDIDFEALVKLDATLVFLMGVAALEFICDSLMEHGMEKDMPAAILERGTTYAQKRVVATVGTLKREADKAGIKSPAIIMVGKVCALSEEFAWFEKKPLFGRQIMITRPKNKISKLAKRLRNLGAQVIELPMIDTIPALRTDDKNMVSELKKAIVEICNCASDENTYKEICLTFTSPQGVRHFFAQLEELDTDIRKILSHRVTFGVLGSGTKNELKKYGIFADYMPDSYSAGELGNLLGNVFLEKYKNHVKDSVKVFMLRARQGSQDLNKELEKCGIAYEDVPIYETVYTKDSAVLEKMVAAFEDNEIDCVMFSSASTVRGFVNTFQKLDYDRINAVCIGKQTAREALKYDMKVQVSKEATIESMVEVLRG